MNTRDTLDRSLGDWFEGDALAPAPVGLLDLVMTTTARRQPRPTWLAVVTGHWVGADDEGAGRRSTSRVAGVLIITVLVALLVGGIAVVGSQLLSARPAPLIPADRGGFTPAGSMEVARERPTATLLRDGRVLVVGGYGGVIDSPGSYPSGTDALATAEIWDPATMSFVPAGSLVTAREGHTAALLRDGRVLVAGGAGPNGILTSAEIWDPATMSFSTTGSLQVARTGATATLLADGRVLVVGGTDGTGMTGSSAEVSSPDAVDAEVWSPDTASWSPAGSLPEARYPAGTLLDDGRVLVLTDVVVTDKTGARTHVPAAASVWDLLTETSTPAGSLAVPRGWDFTTTRLLDGRVLIAGGNGCLKGRGPCISVAAAEIWDPSTMSASLTGPLGGPRSSHAAALLPDGRVLVVGDSLGGRGDTAEVFELK